MPFVWQSYGQSLKIMLNASDVHLGTLSLWIIVNAIYEAASLFSYIFLGDTFFLEEECLPLKSVDGSICFSIHTNFTGSWLQAEEVCNGQGSRLWQAGNKDNWNEVMHFSKHQWYLRDDNATKKLKYNGRINAISLLNSSSIIYLRPSLDLQEVTDDYLSNKINM